MYGLSLRCGCVQCLVVVRDVERTVVVVVPGDEEEDAMSGGVRMRVRVREVRATSS